LQQQRDAERGERDLGDQPCRQVDHDARPGGGARRPAAGEQAGAHEVAADLRHRQEAVDRGADPALAQQGRERWPRARAQQRPPAERVGEQRGEMSEAGQADARAGEREGCGDLGGALRQDQRQHEAEAGEPGDHDRRAQPAQRRSPRSRYHRMASASAVSAGRAR
jgi:hypothetical protein